MADGWAAVLDDLDARLSAAEAGEIAALSDWAPPPQPATPMREDEQSRAGRILERQRTLEDRLRADRAQAAAALAGLRGTGRPNRWVSTSAPVYVDRSA